MSKTDLVNVHNIVFAAGASTEDGSFEKPFTTQCGTIIADANFAATTVFHSRVTENSIIFAVIISGGSNKIYNVIPSVPGVFTITCDSILPPNTRLGWFIAQF